MSDFKVGDVIITTKDEGKYVPAGSIGRIVAIGGSWYRCDWSEFNSTNVLEADTIKWAVEKHKAELYIEEERFDGFDE